MFKKTQYKPLFFEPSLFDGIFLIKNNYFSIKDLDGVVNNDDIDIRKLLDSFYTTQPSVIPDKDNIFSSKIFFKVFNFRNFYKFILKFFNKYFLFRREEFNHIFNHVFRNLKTIINSFKLKFAYDQKIR